MRPPKFTAASLPTALAVLEAEKSEKPAAAERPEVEDAASTRNEPKAVEPEKAPDSPKVETTSKTVPTLASPAPPPPGAPEEPAPPARKSNPPFVGFDPGLIRVAESGATKQAEEEIREEAARREAERRALEEARERASADEEEPARPLTVNDVIKQARKQAGMDRRPFRDDLRVILKKRGEDAGGQIAALVDQYGMDYPAEIHELAARDLQNHSGRLKLEVRVDRLRRLGLPETVILDYIRKQELLNLGTRGGPRNPDEVTVRAARRLLSIPLEPTARRAVAGEPAKDK